MSPESEFSSKPQSLFSSDGFTRRDVFALAGVAALFAVMLVQSWHRWLHPIIDHGREINLPARILAGETLYRDAQFLYGPFAPYFNAFLYRIFGVHLSVAHASGAVCAALITLMIYWLSRRMMGAWESAVTTGLMIVVCAFQPRGNYVQPYTYAALYGLVFALASLVCTARYLQAGRVRSLVWAGVWTGLAMISKLELSLAALASAFAAIAIESYSARKLLWREAASFAAPVIAIAAGALALVLWRVEWRALVDDNYVFMFNTPPQLVYFNKLLSGLVAPRYSLYFSASGLGVAAWWAGGSALVAALVAWRMRLEWRETLKRAVIALALGLAFWAKLQMKWKFPIRATPFSAVAILAPLVALFIGWRVWRARLDKTRVEFDQRLLLVVAVFGFVSTLRVILNVTINGPYTPFFLPVVIVLYLALLFRYAPEFFARQKSIQTGVRLVAMAMVTVVLLQTAQDSIKVFRENYTFPIHTTRGSFITEPHLGRPFLDALRFVEERTAPGDYVVCVPQLTAINFFADRGYPLREEIINPGLLNNDRDSIERIRFRRVPLLLIVSLDTPDFRDRFFGGDYNRELMDWIRQNYHPVAGFNAGRTVKAESGKENKIMGFITAYERNP